MSRGRVSVALHVGAHKTATTHLQHTLAHNRDLLDEAGLRVMLPNELRKPGRSLNERFGINGAAPVDRPGARIVRRLLPEGKSRLVISEENFIGIFRGPAGRVRVPLYPKAGPHIEAFVAKVAPVPVDVFLAVRHPCGFLRSCFSQVLMSDTPVTPERFFLDRGPEVVDWVELIARIRAVPGLRRLCVWPYEIYPGNSIHIFRRLLRWRIGKILHPDSGRSHAGLSEMAVQKVLAWQAGDPDGLPPQQARETYPVGPDWRGFDPFPPEMYSAARADYLHQLAQIAALDGVEILSDPRVPLEQLIPS